MNAFLMTDIHVRLLQRMLVSWNDTQYDNENGGVPGISINRPYGNSDSLDDLAEEANVPSPDWKETGEWGEKEKAFLLYLHRDMQNALQYALYTRHFEPGIYISGYGHYEITDIFKVENLDQFAIKRLDALTLSVEVNGNIAVAHDRVRSPLPKIPFFDDTEDYGFGHVYDIEENGSTVDSPKGVLIGVAIQQFLMKELWGYSIYEQSKLGRKVYDESSDDSEDSEDDE